MVDTSIMDFFASRLRLTPEECARDDWDEEDDDDLLAPEWFGSPDDVIPGRSEQSRILTRSDAIMVALTGIDAFPTGIHMSLVVAARRTRQDRASWREIEDLFSERRRGPAFAQPIADSGQIRFGVAVADGTRATTMDERPVPVGSALQTPPAPVLELRESSGSGDPRAIQTEFTLWLWPLPPPGVLTLHYAWPALGIDAGSVDLDAAELSDAAARSESYWP